MRRTLTVIALAAMLGSTPAIAFCERHPSVAEELRSSHAVLVGEVMSERYVLGGPDDPEGIDAAIYTVKVLKVLRGKLPTHIDIYSENTTARFPIAKGPLYLLFVFKAEEGLVVDNCGNSGPLPARARILHEARRQGVSH